MTLGETIQFNRKSLGLSQDELGQKLLVSRQTVSLWENDQTIPSIDNLLRLKEIFGKSIDEILTGESESELSKEEIPNEEYSCTFSEKEIKAFLGKQRKAFSGFELSASVFIILYLIYTLFMIDDQSNGIVFTIIVNIIIITTLVITKCIVDRKRKNAILQKIKKCEYRYRFYNDCLHITTYRKSSDTYIEYKVMYDDIEKVHIVDNWVFLVINNSIFTLRRNELKENSVIYSYASYHPNRSVVNYMPTKEKTVSNLLFVASIVSIYVAIIIDTKLESYFGMFGSSKYMWVFYLLTPIPIASIAYGVHLKAKGYKKYMKNIFIGAIVFIIMFIFGSFAFTS